MWQHQKIQIERLTFRCVVEYASCAYNNSLFFVATYFPSSEMEMFHVDHLGKILYQKKCSNSSGLQFKMLTDRQVVRMDKHNQYLDMINLQSYEVRKIPLKLTVSITGTLHLEVFPKSRLLVVVEMQKGGDQNKVTMSYFDAKHEHNEPQIYKFKTMNNSCKCCAIDAQSKIAFFNGQISQTLMFSYYSLFNNPNKEFILVKIALTSIQRQVQQAKYLISKIWQIQSNTFIFGICYAQQNNSFLVDLQGVIAQVVASEYEQEASMKVLKVINEGCSLQGPFCVIESSIITLQKKVVSQGNLKLLLSSYQRGSDCIVSTVQTTASFGEYKSNLAEPQFFNTVSEKGKKDVFIFDIIKHESGFTFSQIIVFLLLHLNEDFDDDLLQDSIELFT